MGRSLCVIPARMGSSRYPNKPMAKILGYPMVGHVAKRCLLEPVFDLVVIATCDKDIMDYASSIGVRAVMTSTRHQRATDRVQEAAQILEKELGTTFDIVTMVQGDEPMVTPEMLRLSKESIAHGVAPVTNLMAPIDSVEEFNSPNSIKVVTDKHGKALYFSRAPIPCVANYKQKLPKAYKQVCIISFTRAYLDEYSAMAPTQLEEVESVDMNRILENGQPIYLVETKDQSYPVDVPADIDRVEKHLRLDPFIKMYM